MLKEISNEIRSAFQSNRNGVIQLLVVNIAVFLVIGFVNVVGYFSGSQTVQNFLVENLELSSDPIRFLFHPWTLLTYAFLHQNLMHLLFNMIGLYTFGRILQDFLGPRKILFFYLYGALSGGLLFLLIFNLKPEFRNLLGASGAVYGIICGAAFLVPNYTLYLFIFGPVRLKYIAIAFVLISFVQIPDGNAGGNIAHLGGALGGILYLRYLQGGFRFRSLAIPNTVNKGKVVKMDTGKRQISNEEELDYLLDKISEKGINSLTKDERNRLEILSKPGSNN
jgi:membrane associated rhomboid family serine protease